MITSNRLLATFTWKSYLKVESAVSLERSNRLSDFPDGNRMFQIQDKDRGEGGGVKSLACAVFKDARLHGEFAYPRIST